MYQEDSFKIIIFSRTRIMSKQENIQALNSSITQTNNDLFVENIIETPDIKLLLGYFFTVC